MTLPLIRSPRAATPPPKVTLSLTELEHLLGGRDAIVAGLAHAPKSRELIYVLGLVGNPDKTAVPLAELCAQGGITPGELIEAYKQGELARAQAVATSKIGGRLAAVAEDTMSKALANTDTDVEYKKLALDLGKLLPKSAGVNVAVSQQVGVAIGSAGGALERLQAATDQILYGDAQPGGGAPLEAEVVEGDAEEGPLDTYVEGDWREDPPL